MQALLSEQIFESFRAYSLDTLARLREVDSLSEDVRLSRVKPAAMDAVLEELIWSLSGDAAIRIIAPEEQELLINYCKAPGWTTETLQRLVRMLLNRTAPVYRTTLRDIVVANVSQPNRRGDLLNVTGLLVSHLINDGHSRRFLAQRVEERFFSAPMRRVGPATVRAFIDGISAERRRYVVICSVTPGTGRLLERVGTFDLNELRNLPPHARRAIRKLSDYDPKNEYVVADVTAADGYKAVSQLHDRLSSLRAFMIVPIKRLDVHWSHNSYVYTPRAAGGSVLSRENSFALGHAPAARLLGRRLRQIALIPQQIESNFDGESRERLLSALSTAAVSLETELSETRLISLWSAFEVLLSDPQPGEARIVHYVRNLAPCITAKYHRRLFAAVHEQLWAAFHKRVQKILDRIDHPVPAEQVTRLVKLITLPQHEDERAELLKACSSSPLAMHRLFRLHKYYGTPFAVRKSLEKHDKRVRWQLYRIYRARNNLVHAGAPPPFLDPLAQNALEYFRTAIIGIVKRSTVREGPHNIDQLVFEAGVDWDIQLRILGQCPAKADFDVDMVNRIFSP
jgi:hypothetical protein